MTELLGRLRAGTPQILFFFCTVVYPLELAAETKIIEFGEQWDWLHPVDGVDPAESSGDADFQSTWYQADYDGPAFNAGGSGIFGYGRLRWGNVTTEFDQPPRGSRFTAYFRKSFDVAEDVKNLEMEVFAADAAIIYIDGNEVGRFNIVGDDAYTSLALSQGQGAGSETETDRSPRLINLAIDTLDAGTHLIAVSVHNEDPRSADLGFDLRFSAIDSPRIPIVRVRKSSTGTGDGTSWENAYSSLQDALNAAEWGAEIWVSAGVYFPDEGNGLIDNHPENSFRLRNGIAVYGGFSGTETNRDQRIVAEHSTILSGDIEQDDLNEDGNSIAETVESVVSRNSRSVVIASHTARDAILDGFIITAGVADHGTHAPGAHGGGLVCDSASPTIANCRFSGNVASSRGGAAYLGQFSYPHIVDCSFSHNRARFGGGVSSNFYSLPRFVRCEFSDNNAFARGGGLAYGSGLAILTNCRFIGNTARIGGALSISTGLPGEGGTHSNCIFAGNSASQGGGALYIRRSSPSFINCTFAGNHNKGDAGLRGGSIRHFDGGVSSFKNCIIWGNADDHSTTSPSATIVLGDDPPTVAEFQNSVVANSEGSGLDWNPVIGRDLGGNVATNPVFALPLDPFKAPSSGGDYTALASNLVDAGETSFLPSDRFDIDGDEDVLETLPVDLLGNPRIVAASPDPGAFEHNGPRVLTPVAPLSFEYNSPPQPSVLVLSDVFDHTAETFEVTSASPPGVINASIDPQGSGLSLQLVPDSIGKITLNVTATDASGNSTTYALRILVTAPRLYVNQNATGSNTGLTWTDAFPKLQDGLSAAVEGTEIWVAKGVYYPDEGVEVEDGDRDASFALQNGVALFGGFAGNETDQESRDPSANITVLSGDISQDDRNEDLDFIPDLFGHILGENSNRLVEASFTDESAVIDGFTLTAALNTGDGGAILCRQGSPTIRNCEFIRNGAGHGGAIYVEGGSLALTNCRFVNNGAGGRFGTGGAIAHISSISTISNCSFVDNGAGGDGAGGGAIYNGDSSVLLLKDAVFTDNGAGRGGAVSAESSEIMIENTMFENNFGSTEGGGLSVGDATGWVKHSSFTQNRSGDRGGGAGSAICLSGSSIQIVDCSFTEDGGEFHAGAICVKESSSPTIDRCTFTGNSTRRSGGALLVLQNCSPMIRDSTFRGNTAGTSGGAVWSSGEFSAPVFHRCRFIANSAREKGGACAFGEGSSPIVVDSVFEGNSAERDGGGLLFLESDATLIHCRVLGNSASSGGGVYFNEGKTSIVGSVVAGNRSYSGGGAFHGMWGGTISYINCVFTGNAADGDGGAVYNDRRASPRFANSILWNNSAKDLLTTASATIFFHEGFADGHITSCIIANSGGSGDTWNAALGIDQGGNTDLDPLFLQPADPADAPTTEGDFHLQPKSPGLDSGLNSAGPKIFADLDGNPRYVGKIDLGVYETLTPLPPDSDGDGMSDVFEMTHTDPPSATGLDPSDDSDRDGLTALIESYFGTSPLVRDPDVLTTGGSQDGSLKIRFPETNDGVRLLRMIPESSADLVTWKETEATYSMNVFVDGSTNHVTIEFEPQMPGSEFFRIGLVKR